MDANNWHDLIRNKYGLSKGLKTRQVVNRAIREEAPGGNETLDSIDHFQKMINSMQSNSRQDVDNIRQMIDIVGVTLDRLNEIRDSMGDAIQRQYETHIRS